MDKHALWKWLILIVLTAGSLVVVTPPGEKIRLGLDLKGGTSFTVKIAESRLRNDLKARYPEISEKELNAEVAKVLQGAQERALEVMRNRVDNLGIAEPNIYAGKDNRIIIQLPGIDEQKREQAERSIKSLAFLEFRMVHEDNAELVDQLFDNNLAPEGYQIVRLDKGVFYKREADFPEARRMDPEYKRELGRFQTPSSAYEFMLSKEEVDGRMVYKPSFVKRRREMSGEFLEKASVDYRALGQPVVLLSFDAKGAKRFANITADYAPGGPRNPNPNSSRQLAIVLDGTLYSAPVIREAIFGGKAEISGTFSLAEARLLANILSAGSLPAPVEIVEKRFVSPSLGLDSIRSGVRAVIMGGVGVLAFMLIYYMASGFVADLALGLNMILLPLGMIVAAGFLGIFATDAGGAGSAVRLPVLTLPGIAGIVLTIGMAVDANVLIFERIREEMGSGKRLWTAILSGYDRAFVTIIDANLTTLLTGVILFVFGSGPIRGFSVTLCAGILVSMFTALVVTKLFFDVLVNKMGLKSLKMLSIIRHTAIDFVSFRKPAGIFSVVVIVATVALMAVRGISDPSRIFGVDFLGGSSMTFTFEARQPLDAVRDALAGAGVTEAHIQYQKEMETGRDAFLQIKTTAGETDNVVEQVEQALAAAFPAAGFSLAQEDKVGPQIGAELRGRAVWAIALALVGIVIYLSWRFEFGFAMGAIVALAHDVLFTLGLYSLFGRQLSLPIVAALLTIVGYSVNDTIVVFDRIREDLRLSTLRTKSFKEVCNLSINQTLSRTLLTSLTTLITVVMLLLFGGGAIFDFALALCIGVLVGTYSSIFVATPVVLLWHRDHKPEFATQ